MTDAEFQHYLRRLDLDGPLPPTADTLTRLQAAQLAVLPFESIDPFLGRTPDLSPAALAAKLLHGGRGGYCFELNILLGAALERLGFAPRRVLARVRQRAQPPGARSHLAWLVEADGEAWLADAGFGGPGPLHPLRMAPGSQAAPNGRYRLRDDPATGERVVEREAPGGWQPLYGFDGAHVTDGEVAAANHLCATWELSPFPENLMLAGWQGDTRIGVFNRDVTEEGPHGSTRRTLKGAEDLGAILARLRLRVPAGTVAELWERLA